MIGAISTRVSNPPEWSVIIVGNVCYLTQGQIATSFTICNADRGRAVLVFRCAACGEVSWFNEYFPEDIGVCRKCEPSQIVKLE